MSSETLFREQAEGGVPVRLNAGLSWAERAKRITDYYLPYHLELGRCGGEVDPVLVLSIHSFTRNYEVRAGIVTPVRRATYVAVR